MESVSSCIFNGQTIENGSSVAAYQASSVPFGSTCDREVRLCSNGALSGSYEYAVCGIESDGITSNIDYTQPFDYSFEISSSWKSVPSDDYAFLDYRVKCIGDYTGFFYVETYLRNNSSSVTAAGCGGVSLSADYFESSDYWCFTGGIHNLFPETFKIAGNNLANYDGSESILNVCKNYSARFKVSDSLVFPHYGPAFYFHITSFSDPLDIVDLD